MYSAIERFVDMSSYKNVVFYYYFYYTHTATHSL